MGVKVLNCRLKIYAYTHKLWLLTTLVREAYFASVNGLMRIYSSADIRNWV